MTSFLLLLLLFLIHTAAAADVHSPRLVQRIAFGSCNKADAEQPLWPHVAFYEPDVLLLLGDNVYNDERVFFGVFRANPLPAMAAMYARQKENPGFARVRASVPAVIGTWDDHDYGLNDADGRYVDKIGSQELFLDFFDVAADSPRRARQGVYSSHLHGPVGRRVKFILLDNRYHYNKTSGDVLGDAQWAWLEAELHAGDAELTFIGSGLQVLDAGRVIGELWPRASRLRLAQLIASAAHLTNVMILSGDVHHGELLLAQCIDEGLRLPNTRLYEFTSSGMTHTWCNSLGEGIASLFYYLLVPGSLRVEDLFCQLNFGTVDVLWADDGNAEIVLGLVDAHGARVMEHRLWMSDIRSRPPVLDHAYASSCGRQYFLSLVHPIRAIGGFLALFTLLAIIISNFCCPCCARRGAASTGKRKTD